MRCAISNVAMTIENNNDKIYGFQFHPESFLTENGNLLIKKSISIKLLKKLILMIFGVIRVFLLLCGFLESLQKFYF